MSNTATSAPAPQGLQKVWSDIVSWASVRNLALLAFLMGAAVTIMHRPFSTQEAGDPAIYDYIAQSILRGQVPYRDVVDIKGPGAPYLSALAMLTGKLVGLRDVIAVRVLNLLMVGLLSWLTFLAAQVYLSSSAAGLIAFMVPLMRSQFVEFMIEGTQPKLPMIIFGLLSLLMIARDKPFWSGVSSMLACLCWQPGLMFTGVAFLMFSRYLTSWRDRRAFKVLLGAAIPLAGVLSYFYARGALGDLWAWTITYNYTVFGPDAERGTGVAFDHLWIVIRRTFERDTILVLLALIGLLMFCIERVRAKIKHGLARESPDLFRDAVLLPPLVYFVFSLINFQGGPDTIPFFPFIGIFAGWAVVQFGRLIAASKAVQRAMPKLRVDLLPVAIAAAAIFVFVLVRAVTYRADDRTLQDQYTAIKPLSELLGPQDQIYVHGSLEVLVLMNKPNLNPYIFLDWGADDFAAARKSTSFAAIIDEMEAQAPKLVSISRLRKVNHRADLERWVDQHYDKLVQYNYDKVLIRRQP
jgi:hypothetical protein